MKNILILATLALLLCISSNAQVNERRRGKFLRTEILETTKKQTFAMSLKPGESPVLQMEFQRKTILTHHEVKLYEVLMEVVRQNDGEGITSRGAVDYILIPGETYKGEKTVREEIVTDGLAAGEIFTINDWTAETNANGIWLDNSQKIFSLFDDMRLNFIDLTATHPALGTASLRINRNFIKRETPAQPGTSTENTVQLMDALKQDYTQLRQSGTAGLKVKLTVQEKAAPGEIISVIAEVENTGNLPVCNLLGRTFSSRKSIDGKLFYFGSIQPGKKASFFRLVQMPDSKGICFGAVAFWSILGPANENQCQFKITVE